MDTKRVLLLTPDYPPALGGIQSLLGQLSSNLGQRWSVTVITPGHTEAATYDNERASRVRVRRLRTRWRAARAPVIWSEMAALAYRTEAHVVVAGHAAVLPAAVAAARGRPLVLIAYGNELWASWARPILTTTASRISAVLAISRFTAAQAESLGVRREKVVVWRPGVAPPSVPAHPEKHIARAGVESDAGGNGPRYLLTVSRLTEPHKGQDMLIRALPAVLSRHPRLRYVIAGSGFLASRLQQIAVAHGVADFVIMPGAVSEDTKAALLSRCVALAMPSRISYATGHFEGLGLVYAEAAFVGRPSIGPNEGGAAEAIVHERTGLLVDPRSELSLADAMLRLLDDPSYADRLGAQARLHAEEAFGWDHSVLHADKLLSELL